MYLTVRCHVDVVPKADKVIAVRKSHHTPRIVLGHREEETKSTLDTFSKTTSKSIKDEMRILLAHGAASVHSDFVSQCDIMQRELNGRPMRKMRYDHGVWYTTMLMHNNQICDTIRTRCSG